MLVAQLLLLAVQIKREQQVRLIRVWAVELVSPLQRAAAWIIDGVGGRLERLHRPAPPARGKSSSCRASWTRLKMRNAELEGRAAEADRLAGLLGFPRRSRGSAHAGGARDRRQSRCRQPALCFIEPRLARRRAARHGRDHAGRRGRQNYRRLSRHLQVLLLSDKESGVGALLADTRTQGPVKGTGEPR